MEKNKNKLLSYVSAFMFFIVIVPLIVALVINTNLIETDTSNGWIGFWGNYLGALSGGLITLFVLQKTILEGRKIQNRNEQIKYLEKTVDDLAKYATLLMNARTSMIGYMRSLQTIGSWNEQSYMEALSYFTEASQLEYVLDVELNFRDDSESVKEQVKMLEDKVQKSYELLIKLRENTFEVQQKEKDVRVDKIPQQQLDDSLLEMKHIIEAADNALDNMKESIITSSGALSDYVVSGMKNSELKN